MISAAPVAGAATAQPVTPSTSARVHASPETARASVGEAAPSNVKLATASAVTAPEQIVVAPRLRDQETAERTERAAPAKDSPTGPPPSFEESPLERQARVALDPPDVKARPAFDVVPTAAAKETDAETEEIRADDRSGTARDEAVDPPPTPTERAEAGFAETRMLAEPPAPATVDLDL